MKNCYCKTNNYFTIRRDVIGYGRSLVVGIDFKKKSFPHGMTTLVIVERAKSKY